MKVFISTPFGSYNIPERLQTLRDALVYHDVGVYFDVDEYADVVFVDMFDRETLSPNEALLISNKLMAMIPVVVMISDIPFSKWPVCVTTSCEVTHTIEDSYLKIMDILNNG